MIHYNKDWTIDALKLSEEMSELSTRIIQQVNKPHKDIHAKIQDEVADVAYRLNKMILWYDAQAIRKRMVDKWGNKNE